MSCNQSDILHTEAIELALTHAKQNGLETDLDFKQIFGTAGLNFDSITSMTVDDALAIAEQIPVLGDFAKSFGSFISKGIEIAFGPQDSGVPGTDFNIDIIDGGFYANINSGAWAVLAQKYLYAGSPAFLCSSKQGGYLRSLKRGYLSLYLTPEQLDESRLFILMNLRNGAYQPDSTQSDAVNLGQAIESKSGDPVSGTPIGVDPTESNFLDSQNPSSDNILMYLGLGLLLFMMFK